MSLRSFTRVLFEVAQADLARTGDERGAVARRDPIEEPVLSLELISDKDAKEIVLHLKTIVALMTHDKFTAKRNATIADDLDTAQRVATYLNGLYETFSDPKQAGVWYVFSPIIGELADAFEGSGNEIYRPSDPDFYVADADMPIKESVEQKLKKLAGALFDFAFDLRNPVKAKFYKRQAYELMHTHRKGELYAREFEQEGGIDATRAGIRTAVEKGIEPS